MILASASRVFWLFHSRKKLLRLVCDWKQVERVDIEAMGTLNVNQELEVGGISVLTAAIVIFTQTVHQT